MSQPVTESNTAKSKKKIKTFPIIENTKIWAIVSGILLLVSFGAMLVSTFKYKSPLLLGIDFVGGTTIEYKFSSPQDKLTSQNVQNNILATIDQDLAKGSIIQVSNKEILILRTKELNTENRDKLEELLKTQYGEYNIQSVDTVSATLGPELLRSGLIALVTALLGIMLFVGYRFRRDFAFCTIAALIHDVSIVIGLFAILGLVFKLEVNSLFLTACLTVLGFSVHDTIVVFDRVRENMRFLSKRTSFAEVINMSIRQVWFRSFGTSITLLFALGTLFLLGGDSTRIFAGAMFVGMLTGTYSSLFVAPVLLFQLNKKSQRDKPMKRAK